MRQEDKIKELEDVLSPLALKIMQINSKDAYVKFVVPGDGNAEAATLLRDIHPSALFLRPPLDADDANAVLSALWLWHDWLDESHRISQSIHTPAGSFWHAIMHRREGDFSNSKYWYARCRNHPALDEVLALQQELTGKQDINAFVDLCELVHDSPGHDQREHAQRLQRIEWFALFIRTVRSAISQ